MYKIWYSYSITDPATATSVGSADTYFLLTLQDLCYTNVPSVTATTDDVSFVIDVQDANHGLAISSGTYTVATTVAGCTITTTLEIYDDATDTWIEYDPTPGTGNAANYPWINS